MSHNEILQDKSPADFLSKYFPCAMNCKMTGGNFPSFSRRVRYLFDNLRERGITWVLLGPLLVAACFRLQDMIDKWLMPINKCFSSIDMITFMTLYKVNSKKQQFMSEKHKAVLIAGISYNGICKRKLS